jgi:hypothetical protein
VPARRRSGERPQPAPPQATKRRVQGRAVASVEALVRAARDREGMGSVVER